MVCVPGRINFECVNTHPVQINHLSYFGDTEVWPKHSSLGRKKIGENSLVCVPTVPGEITLNVTTQPVQINYLSYLATWPKHSSLGGEKTVREINFSKYMSD